MIVLPLDHCFVVEHKLFVPHLQRVLDCDMGCCICYIRFVKPSGNCLGAHNSSITRYCNTVSADTKTA